MTSVPKSRAQREAAAATRRAASGEITAEAARAIANRAYAEQAHRICRAQLDRAQGGA